MSDQDRAPTLPAPGWYHDPAIGAVRWWDGASWAAPEIEEPGNGPAVASLVLGICSVVLFITIIGMFVALPAALVGLITGAFGLVRASRISGRGRVLAIVGLVLSTLPPAAFIAGMLLG